MKSDEQQSAKYQCLPAFGKPNNSPEPGSAEPEVAAGLAAEAAWPAPKAAALRLVLFLYTPSMDTREVPKTSAPEIPYTHVWLEVGFFR